MTPPAAAKKTVTVPAIHPVAVQMRAILEELADAFKERRAPLEAIILAVLAKEHVFLLGPPGTAKTGMIVHFFSRILDAVYFETILSKNRPSEAVLGPYDIPALRDHGDLHRKINGFLPTCNFAMLDEVGKMSPTLGHDLLSVVLERKLHQVNGGRSFIMCPLYSFVGGSNELPTDESDDALALWDRMLVRVIVEYLKETGNFAAMLVNHLPDLGSGATVPFADLADVIDNVIPTIRIPRDVVETIVQLRESLRTEGIVPSDRRWKQATKLLQAAAFMQGRDEVTVDDIQVLRYALWDTPTQIQKVERMTLKVSNPLAEKALELLEIAEEIAKESRSAKGLANDKKAGTGVALNGRLKVLSADLGAIRQKALTQGMSTTKLDEVSDRVASIKSEIRMELLGIDG
jgi:MoxR-like ATPase